MTHGDVFTPHRSQAPRSGQPATESSVKSFGDRKTEALFEGRLAGKRLTKLVPPSLQGEVQSLITAMKAGTLKLRPGHNLEQLKDGRLSIRVGDTYRFVFRLRNQGEIHDLSFTKHYGDH